MNFTLDNAYYDWSQEEDFGILDNLEERYLDHFELSNSLIQLANENPDLIKTMANFGQDGRKALNFVIISSKVRFVISFKYRGIKVAFLGFFFLSN